MRKIWNKYFNEATCIVFMIDGADSFRFDEVKNTLDELYSSEDSELINKPLLILLNKCDSETFMNEEQICSKL